MLSGVRTVLPNRPPGSADSCDDPSSDGFVGRRARSVQRWVKYKWRSERAHEHQRPNWFQVIETQGPL
jgi:hypothetical protein